METGDQGASGEPNVEAVPVKILAVVAALLGSFVGCTAAQLEADDPVTYVSDVACPDAHGVPQPVIAGYQCCADHGLGPGQCPDDASCMMPDSCSGPLPPTDPGGFGARRLQRRAGL